MNELKGNSYIFANKKIKPDHFLPFTYHNDLFIFPAHFIIKKETSIISQLIENEAIELEKEVKKQLIEQILAEIKKIYQKELKNVIEFILKFY